MENFGAIALKIALLFPHRVKALALFEPTFFSVVEHESPSPNDVDGIRHAVAAAGAARIRVYHGPDLAGSADAAQPPTVRQNWN